MRIMSLMAAVLLPIAVASVAHAQRVQDSAGYLARMDSDHDSVVSLDEYLQWMMESFNAMDRNHDGMLDVNEHPGAAQRPIAKEAYRANLIAGFNRQDSNRDGHLDARELAAPPQ